MATITISDDDVHIALTRVERVFGLLRSVRIPLHAIESVEAVEGGLAAVRGWRAPGLGIPFVRALGT